MQTHILIDGNAVGYTNHHRDPVLNAEGKQVQATVGFLESIREIRADQPEAKITVLWDGRSWRKDVLPSYKETREADLSAFDTSAPMSPAARRSYDAALKKNASREAYQAQVPLIKEALSYLAIPQITCGNYEADDLAAVMGDTLVEKGHPVRLVTSDGDWYQLIRNRVVVKSPRAPFRIVSALNFKEFTGYLDPQQFVEAKMLIGDKGDCVPGLLGFGDVTSKHFFSIFGGIDEFLAVPSNQIVSVWHASVGKKPPKCILELHAAGPKNPLLSFNRMLVDLRTPNRPPAKGIVTQKGEIDPARLSKLCKSLDLYRISSDLATFMKAFTGE